MILSEGRKKSNINVRTLEVSGVLFLQKGVIGQWKEYFTFHWVQLFV